MSILQDKINNSNFSMTDIAHELGVSSFSVYRKITGRSSLKRSELYVLSLLLDLNEDEIEKIQEELRVLYAQFRNTSTDI